MVKSFWKFVAICMAGVLLFSSLFSNAVLAEPDLQENATIWFVSPAGDASNGLSW